ncbi:hypothetical protein BC826DRAFT_1112078 [Russula brevipes]|nr:hypothetical protein BC826DRAFT_1112078 [Russula brevipes]
MNVPPPLGPPEKDEDDHTNPTPRPRAPPVHLRVTVVVAAMAMTLVRGQRTRLHHSPDGRIEGMLPRAHRSTDADNARCAHTKVLNAPHRSCGYKTGYRRSSSWINDSTLATLIGRVLSHCIVLLEDLDAAFTHLVSRAKDKDKDKEKSTSKSDNKDESTTSSSSRSRRSRNKENLSDVNTLRLRGLLNALDGVATAEGRILFALPSPSPCPAPPCPNRPHPASAPPQSPRPRPNRPGPAPVAQAPPQSPTPCPGHPRPALVAQAPPCPALLRGPCSQTHRHHKSSRTTQSGSLSSWPHGHLDRVQECVEIQSEHLFCNFFPSSYADPPPTLDSDADLELLEMSVTSSPAAGQLSSLFSEALSSLSSASSCSGSLSPLSSPTTNHQVPVAVAADSSCHHRTRTTWAEHRDMTMPAARDSNNPSRS